MIKIYSKENCKQCELIKTKLKEKELEFEEIKDENKLMELAREYRIMSAPIIIWNELVLDFRKTIEKINTL